MMHPAEEARLRREDPDEWSRMVWTGEAESGIHWKVVRIAELTGLDPKALERHVEIERGWEPHDRGYLHQVVVSARVLLFGYNNDPRC